MFLLLTSGCQWIPAHWTDSITSCCPGQPTTRQSSKGRTLVCVQFFINQKGRFNIKLISFVKVSIVIGWFQREVVLHKMLHFQLCISVPKMFSHTWDRYQKFYSWTQYTEASLFKAHLYVVCAAWCPWWCIWWYRTTRLPSSWSGSCCNRPPSVQVYTCTLLVYDVTFLTTMYIV